MVSRAHGIWTARAGQPVDFGRPARSGNEREGQQRREISRVVASVRAVDEEGSGRRVSGERERFAFHDTYRAGAAGDARSDSLGDARGWKRAAANGGERDQSALLAAHRRIWETHRRAG